MINIEKSLSMLRFKLWTPGASVKDDDHYTTPLRAMPKAPTQADIANITNVTFTDVV